jgi:hypothetical protein
VTPRILAYATIAVMVVAVLMTAHGIQERLASARLQATPVALASRFHEGPEPCRRYITEAMIAAPETTTVAATLVSRGFTRWMPEALVLSWSWARDDEARHHALDQTT